MKVVHDAKKPDREDRYIATPGELAVFYVGPQSLLLATDNAVVPLMQTAFAYSFDHALRRYRWTAQRPLCEHRDRFIDKVRRTVRAHGTHFGVGVVLNGHEMAPKDSHRRGVWLGNCALDDLVEAMSVAMQQPVLDVVSGLAETHETWDRPPVKPWTELEY